MYHKYSIHINIILTNICIDSPILVNSGSEAAVQSIKMKIEQTRMTGIEALIFWRNIRKFNLTIICVADAQLTSITNMNQY